MAESVKYLVKLEGGTAFLVVCGRASYLNCKSCGEFFDYVVRKNCAEVKIDFSQCQGMDSTFMGMIASLALKMRELNLEGGVCLYNLSERNQELVENLGLDALVKLGGALDFKLDNTQTLDAQPASKWSILNAHKKLVEIDSGNASKFQDVIAFLQKAQSEEDKL